MRLTYRLVASQSPTLIQRFYFFLIVKLLRLGHRFRIESHRFQVVCKPYEGHVKIIPSHHYSWYTCTVRCREEMIVKYLSSKALRILPCNPVVMRRILWRRNNRLFFVIFMRTTLTFLKLFKSKFDFDLSKTNGTYYIYYMYASQNTQQFRNITALNIKSNPFHFSPICFIKRWNIWSLIFYYYCCVI